MPVLAVDIGNSTLSSALCLEDKTWYPLRKFSTRRIISEQKTLEFQNEVRDFFLRCCSGAEQSPRLRNTGQGNDNGTLVPALVVLSSVVPDITACIERILNEIFSCPLLLVSTKLKSPLQAPVPEELGTDLFANAVAGHSKSRGKASTTIDFGTALSFTAVRGNGSIAGVAIATGIDTGLEALVSGAAGLSSIALQVPQTVLGSTTEAALCSGLVLGTQYLVSGLCERIAWELGEPCQLYATGGNAELYETVPELFDETDPYHTLKGLVTLAEWNQ